MDEVTSWVCNTLRHASETEDKVMGAKTLWFEWAKIEHKFPGKFRAGTVRMLDDRLCAAGLPSLRELVSLQNERMLMDIR